MDAASDSASDTAFDSALDEPSMGRTRRRGDSSWSWLAMAAVMALGACALTALSLSDRAAPTLHRFDWEASGFNPWRLWTAAWLHWNPWHLLSNVMACGVVAYLGWAARMGSAATLAWLLAWPLTQALLIPLAAIGVMVPAHVGGLSGALHAGTTIVAAWLLVLGSGRSRIVGLLIAAGLVIKLIWEWMAGPQPLLEGQLVLSATAVHLSGVIAGAISATLLLALTAPSRRAAQRELPLDLASDASLDVGSGRD
jgi:membrane associated rhomboid family serine protease